MADNAEAVAQFMSITGANAETATQYLELTNGSLAEAVNLFMESGGESVGGGGNTMPPAAPMAGGYDDDVRAPDPSKRQRLFGDSALDSVPMRRLHEQYRDFAAESIAAINASSRSSAISAAFTGGDSDESNRTRDFSSLFVPPVDIMFKGTYSEARALAKSEGKWLLVNIQDEIVFASHMLNRDTWSDDVVQNVVASGYVFWQHFWVSEHGKKFCSLYQIDRDHLPIIAIVNPKTGEIASKWTGFVEPQTMTERLSDFSFTHSYEAEEASSSGGGQRHRDITEASEDDQLAAAIAASLEGAASDQGSDNYDDAEEKAEEPPAQQVVDPMPEEPADGTPDVTRVQIRGPDGSRLVRRFLKTDKASLIWLFVKHQIPEARSRGFELRTTFPPKAVAVSEDATIDESKLANASLMLQWT